MKDILQELYLGSVVSIELNEKKDKVHIDERCDQWFGMEYNKEDFARLIEQLQKLHDEMI